MKRATVVILIDALGREIAEKHRFEVHQLKEAATIKTVLGFSQAAILSILTSMTPREHGKWMMYSFASGKSPFSWTKILPSFISARRLWFRRLLQYKLEKINGVTSYYSLYSIPRSVLPYLDLPLRRNYFRCGALHRVPTILDKLSEAGVFFRVWDYESAENENFDELSYFLETGKEGFYLLYTAELDSILHKYGTESEGVREKLAYYEAEIGRIVSSALRNFDDPRIFVFGDHGMCDVSKAVNLMRGIENLDLEIPDDYVPFYDSTMARFRISSDRARERIMDFLSAQENGSVLSKDECLELGVPAPSDLFGDIIFLANTGTIILPSFMGTQPVSGMHGYHPDSRCMDSILLSNIEIGHERLNLTDIAQLLLRGFVLNSAKENA